MLNGTMIRNGITDNFSENNQPYCPMSETEIERQSEVNEFEAAGEQGNASFLGEFIFFLKTNKKYWMIPILLALLGLGALILLGGTSAAPFIYTLF